MKTYITISEFSELQHLLTKNKRVLIFKHSTRCPISSRALDEYTNFLSNDPDLVCTYIDVIKDRPISLEIESALHVRHESPQAIFVEDNQVKWSGSHGAITSASLAQATR